MHNPTTIQTNIWKRILWFTMCLLIYVLSFGPATFVANRIALPGDLVGKFVEIVYSPLILRTGFVHRSTVCSTSIARYFDKLCFRVM